MKKRTPIYKCLTCGYWSRKELKVLELNGVAICHNCGSIMWLEHVALLPEIDDNKLFQELSYKYQNNNIPRNYKGGRIPMQGETKREKEIIEAQERREKGETRGRKPPINKSIGETQQDDI